MINLSDIRPVKKQIPPILTIYGRPGMGKTNLAHSFPDAIFVQTEDGSGDLEINTFTPEGFIQKYVDLCNAFQQLYTQPHHYKTLILDSINHAEPLVTKYVCEMNGWANIESAGYGKGFNVLAAEFHKMFEWLELLRNHRGMNIILLGHPDAMTAPDPHLEEHKRFAIKMDKRNASLTLEKCDGVFLLDKVITMSDKGAGVNGEGPKKASTGNQRILYTDGGASFEAKTRFDAPKTVLIPKENGYGAMPFLPGQDKLGLVSKNHPNYLELATALGQITPEPVEEAPVEQVEEQADTTVESVVAAAMSAETGQPAVAQ